MTCDVNSGVAIKKIVINDAVGRDAAVLSPNMQAIVMIGVGSRVPLHIIMDVVVMYRKTRGGSLRTESKPGSNVYRTECGPIGRRQNRIGLELDCYWACARPSASDCQKLLTRRTNECSAKMYRGVRTDLRCARSPTRRVIKPRVRLSA